MDDAHDYDAVAEAFARMMARGAAVREPEPYLYRVAFRVASAELARREKEAPTDLAGYSVTRSRSSRSPSSRALLIA